MTFPSKVRPSRAWRRTSAASPRSTSGASVSGTPTEMVTTSDAGDDEERLAGGPRRRQVAGVEVPAGDDAVEGGLDLRVADHGLGPPDLRLGRRRRARRPRRRPSGPCRASASAWTSAASADLTWARTSSRAASAALSLLRVSSRRLPVTRRLADELLDPVELRLPAGDVGLGPADAGLDLGHLRLGAGDPRLGDLDGRLGLLPLGLGLLDQRPLLLEVRLDLGHVELGEHLALLDLVADVDGEAPHVARRAWRGWA